MPCWPPLKQGNREMRRRKEGERKEEGDRNAQAARLRRWHSYSPICQSDYLARYRVAHTKSHTLC